MIHFHHKTEGIPIIFKGGPERGMERERKRERVKERGGVGDSKGNEQVKQKMSELWTESCIDLKM